MILGNRIINDIMVMEKKSLDISLIEKENSDLTFFNIDEQETNETLKALKQSYVTTNYKEETILNLQGMLNNSLEDTSKELKIESFKHYNEALNLAARNYITTAIEIIEKAVEINPKDIDILNLKGLLKLLKCDFSKAFESFYTAMCYGNDGLSRKYVDILSSEEFKIFLARYNHSIRFINEELNQESIHILNNIIEEDPYLIEPYVILTLLYDKMGNLKKKEYYLSKLQEIDKDNSLFEIKVDNVDEKDKRVKDKPKKSILPYMTIAILGFGMIAYHINSKNKIETLNAQLVEKNEKINTIDKELTQTNEKLSEASQQLNETNQKLDETNKALNNSKNQEILFTSESELYDKATKLKSAKNYKEAISYFKKIVENGKSKKYISESIYQIAVLSEKTKDYDQAVKYYKKYINTYHKDEQYYDDAFYQLGMLYYDMGDLANAKKIFYGLRSEVPNSMYNNSKVQEILSK